MKAFENAATYSGLHEAMFWLIAEVIKSGPHMKQEHGLKTDIQLYFHKSNTTDASKAKL